MNGLLLRGALAAVGFWLGTYFVSGLHFDTAATLIVAGLLLGVMNAFLRPLLILLTLPLTVLSLGVFLLIINAGMVALVAWFMPGMRVAGFGSAVGAALIVSIVSWIGGALTRR